MSNIRRFERIEDKHCDVVASTFVLSTDARAMYAAKKF